MKKQIIFYIINFAMLQSCRDAQHKTEEQPVLLSQVGNKASCVFLAKNEKNKPVVSWTEVDSSGSKHFYFANWNEQTQKFEGRITIPIETNTSIHEEGMPKIAFMGDGTMIATYEISNPSKKSRFGLSDILYTMSTDNGKTWTSPKSIQYGVQQAGSRSFGNMIRLDDGEIGICWLDTNPNDATSGRPVMFARTNGKKGFENGIVIESTACQCCRTALSSDGQGNVSIVFRDLLSGSVRDISVCNSSDNGRTFRKTVPFSKDHWVLEGCPHNGPSVVNKDDKTYVTWFTGSKQKGVYYAELDKNNEMLQKRQLDPNGRFVQVCLTPDGTRLVTYNVNYQDGDSLYNKIKVMKINKEGFFEKEITLPHAQASYPVVQVTGAHIVVVAWTDNEKVFYKSINSQSISKAASTELAQPAVTNAVVAFPRLSSSIDPVCGMKLNPEMTGDTTAFKGKIIGFCGQDCKDKFLRSRNAYAL